MASAPRSATPYAMRLRAAAQAARAARAESDVRLLLLMLACVQTRSYARLPGFFALLSAAYRECLGPPPASLEADKLLPGPPSR